MEESQKYQHDVGALQGDQKQTLSVLELRLKNLIMSNQMKISLMLEDDIRGSSSEDQYCANARLLRILDMISNTEKILVEVAFSLAKGEELPDGVLINSLKNLIVSNRLSLRLILQEDIRQEKDAENRAVFEKLLHQLDLLSDSQTSVVDAATNAVTRTNVLNDEMRKYGHSNNINQENYEDK